MADPAMSVGEQLAQLDQARKAVLSDAKHYPQILHAILPIVGPDARIELRRWGADFLAETFASPALPAEDKEKLSMVVLKELRSMIENPNEDSSVVKSVVQTAASIYPHVFRWIINNAHDTTTWETMVAIKSRILRIWDSSATGVRICCIKFAQRVVLVQTSGPDADARHTEASEISLSMVPKNHSLIPPRNLEAEASGLLDRMLSVFQEHASDAVLVDSTLNCLSLLIRARPSIAPKIINAILNFNPLKLANSPMTPKNRVMIKSMEKTTRMLLIHINKRDPQNPLAGRIQQYVERLMRTRTEIFDEATRKRAAPEPANGADLAKRQRTGVAPPSAPQSIRVPPLTPGQHSIAELFTVTGDEALKAFDVGQLPEDLVVKISVIILSRIDSNLFDQAIEGVRTRLATLKASTAQALVPAAGALGPAMEEDDDDYEPDFQPAEDEEQIVNKLDAPVEDAKPKAVDMALGPFRMPPPPPMTHEQTLEFGQGTVARVFGVMQTLEEPSSKKSKAGINRLAASTYDQAAWITVLTRLATRATAGLESLPSVVKSENDAQFEAGQSSLSNRIRENLEMYVLEDFRKRIDIAVAWLCEEWYNDKIQMRVNEATILHYEKWTLRLLDRIIPYLDSKDKILMRFLSEIPELGMEVMNRVKGLCRNPEMVTLALTSLLYVVMMKPPAREMALNTMEDIWKNYDDAKPVAAKHLSKWRPGFIERQSAADETKPSLVQPQNGLSVT